jgi:hypothetical protein
MEKPEGRKIKVLFSKAPDYRKIAATGVWGGPAPTGEILCNFFIDQMSSPDELEITLSPTGEKELENPIFKEEKTVIRELQVCVIMSPLIAKSVGEWMIKRAEEVILKGTTH